LAAIRRRGKRKKKTGRGLFHPQGTTKRGGKGGRRANSGPVLMGRGGRGQLCALGEEKTRGRGKSPKPNWGRKFCGVCALFSGQFEGIAFHHYGAPFSPGTKPKG